MQNGFYNAMALANKRYKDKQSISYTEVLKNFISTYLKSAFALTLFTIIPPFNRSFDWYTNYSHYIFTLRVEYYVKKCFDFSHYS